MGLLIIITKTITCKHCGKPIDSNNEIGSLNITHNLNVMAEAVSEDFYKAIWRPEELNANNAQDIVDIIIKGLNKIENNPQHYIHLNPRNYYDFVEFLHKYVDILQENPDATIKAYR